MDWFERTTSAPISVLCYNVDKDQQQYHVVRIHLVLVGSDLGFGWCMVSVHGGAHGVVQGWCARWGLDKSMCILLLIYSALLFNIYPSNCWPYSRRCRFEFFGHVHRFRTYSFGHLDSVMWTFLIKTSGKSLSNYPLPLLSWRHLWMFPKSFVRLLYF